MKNIRAYFNPELKTFIAIHNEDMQTAELGTTLHEAIGKLVTVYCGELGITISLGKAKGQGV